MAEADRAAGDPNAPREVENDASAEQQSKVRPTPIPTDRGWWDVTAAAIQLPPLPTPPGAPPAGATPVSPTAPSSPGAPAVPAVPAPVEPAALRATLPGLSGGGRTPTDASLRPIPTLDPRPITAADLEDETRVPFVASLLATRPTATWLSLGMVAVGVAFVSGLLLGHGRAPKSATAPTAGTSAAPSAPPPVSVAATASAAPPATPPASATPPAAVSPAPSADALPAAPSVDATKNAPPKGALEPFNAKAARTNLSVAVARAQRCREQTAPAGSVSAVVTFVASGRVADVTVITPTYAGTRTGKCIVSKLKTAQVPPFNGEPETMKKTFVLK